MRRLDLAERAWELKPMLADFAFRPGSIANCQP